MMLVNHPTVGSIQNKRTANTCRSRIIVVSALPGVKIASPGLYTRYQRSSLPGYRPQLFQQSLVRDERDITLHHRHRLVVGGLSPQLLHHLAACLAPLHGVTCAVSAPVQMNTFSGNLDSCLQEQSLTKAARRPVQEAVV